MKRILLATVATLPLLALGMNPAASQDLRPDPRHQGNAGVSQSRGPAAPQGKVVQHKAEGAAKMNESSGAKMNQSSGSQMKSEQVKEQGKTEGRTLSGHEGSTVAAGRDPEKAKGEIKSGAKKAEPKQAQTDVHAQGKDRTSGQANAEKAKQEFNAGAKSQLSESQSKGKKADEKLSKGPQSEPARTTGQATRTNQESDRVRQGSERVQRNEHVQPNGTVERRGGEAGGRVTLNEEQRTRIEKTVLSGRDVPRVDRVDFAVDVGAVVPRHVRFARVPRTLVEINQEWRDDEYFIVRDEIVIVDRGRRIVGVVPVRSSSASFETHSRSTFAAGDVDIRRVQEVLLEKGYYHGPVDGVFGRATRDALIRFQEREGIEARGSIDERTYVALGISGRIEGRSEGRIEGRPEARFEGRQEGRPVGHQEGRIEGHSGSRIEGHNEGRALHTEEKGRLDRNGQSELRRSSVSGEARGSSKSSEPRHVNARDDNAKNDGGRARDKTGQGNRASASGQGEKPPSIGENKATEQHRGTVGQSMRSQDPSAKSSKSGGASENQRKHD